MRAHCVRFQTFTMMSSMLPSTRCSKHQLLDCLASGRSSVRRFPASEKRTLEIGTAPAGWQQPSRSRRKPTPELVRQAGFGHETDITDERRAAASCRRAIALSAARLQLRRLSLDARIDGGACRRAPPRPGQRESQGLAPRLAVDGAARAVGQGRDFRSDRRVDRQALRHPRRHPAERVRT
jgi:hypothetical protein